MTTYCPAPPTNRPPSFRTLKLNVVLFYEDEAIGAQGLKLFQNLIHRLGDDAACQLSQWSFAVLAVPQQRRLTAAEAAQADLIVVCSSGDAALPAAVDERFGDWMLLETTEVCGPALLLGSPLLRLWSSQMSAFVHKMVQLSGVSLFPLQHLDDAGSLPLPRLNGVLPAGFHIQGWEPASLSALPAAA